MRYILCPSWYKLFEFVLLWNRYKNEEMLLGEEVSFVLYETVIPILLQATYYIIFNKAYEIYRPPRWSRSKRV